MVHPWRGRSSPASLPGVRSAANVHRTFGPCSPLVDRNASRGSYTRGTQVFGLHLTRLDADGRVGNACCSEATAAHFRLALHAESIMLKTENLCTAGKHSLAMRRLTRLEYEPSLRFAPCAPQSMLRWESSLHILVPAFAAILLTHASLRHRSWSSCPSRSLLRSSSHASWYLSFRQSPERNPLGSGTRGRVRLRCLQIAPTDRTPADGGHWPRMYQRSAACNSASTLAG